jgi:WXG100 family type VII secretion target
MSKRIRVTPEELQQASGQLAEFSATYTDIYTNLLQQASTMGQAWEGADNQQFVNQIQGFTEELKSMAQKLQTASDALKTQATNYADRQQSNIQAVQQLTN